MKGGNWELKKFRKSRRIEIFSQNDVFSCVEGGARAPQAKAATSSCCTGADVIIAGTGRKASLPANTFNCDSFCIFPQFYQLPTANCLMTSNFPNPNPSCQRQLPKSKSQMPNNAIKFLDKLRNIGSCNSCGAQA